MRVYLKKSGNAEKYIIDNFIAAGSISDYQDGESFCLPCKPGVYAIKCSSRLNVKHKSEFDKKSIQKIRSHTGKILYIGSTNNLNYRLSQLINNYGHVAGPKFACFNKKTHSKMLIMYLVCKKSDQAQIIESSLIENYNYYKNAKFKYPPFNSRV